MSDDFRTGSAPTVEAVKAVWDEIEASGRKASGHIVAEIMRRRGAKISHATVSRYKASGWVQPENKREGATPMMLQGKVAHVDPKVRAQADKVEEMVGRKLTDEEAKTIAQEISELEKKTPEELKAIEQRDVLIYRIMMARFGARRADALVLVPRDSSEMVTALTEAQESLSTIPAAKLVGNGSMIDVTPNPTNVVSSAIEAFQRKRQAG